MDTQTAREARPALRGEAFAKVNLCMEVLGRRADGRHEVATVLQTVSLADRLTFAAGAELVLRCRGMQTDQDNLILRAARLLSEVTGLRGGAMIRCHKRIPVGAGLGGGSSDAAATLVMVNELWRVGLSSEELESLASPLGADVPFFVRGGTALATDTGTSLHPLPAAPPHWVVLVPVGSAEPGKTGTMYRSLAEEDFSDGSGAEALAQAIARGELPHQLIRSAFENAARLRWPTVDQALRLLRDSGALSATVSGSGPSTFGLYPTRQAALTALRMLGAHGFSGRVCRFVGAGSVSLRG